MAISTPFLHIDSALAVAGVGDTIFVDAGIYYTTETITIRDNGISLVGKDSSATGTLIDFLDSSMMPARCIYAHTKSGVYLRDFRVINGRYGVWFRNVDSSVIERVQADLNAVAGIQLDTGSPGSYHNMILNSAASGNAIGFKLHASGSNTLIGNSATNNTDAGFLLDTSSGNTLQSNVATGNADGFVLRSSSDANVLESNTSTGNADAGIVLLDADSNTLSENTIADNEGYALVLDGTTSGGTYDSNEISGSTEHPDSAVFNATTAEVDLSTTDFGTEDEATIRRKIAGPGKSNVATEGFVPGRDVEPEPLAEIVSPSRDINVLRTCAVEIIARPLRTAAARALSMTALRFQYRSGEEWIDLATMNGEAATANIGENGEARIIWDAKNMPEGAVEFRAVPVTDVAEGAERSSSANSEHAAFHAIRFTTDVEAADFATDMNQATDTVSKRQRVASTQREVIAAIAPSGALVTVVLDTGIVPVRSETQGLKLIVGLAPRPYIETASLPLGVSVAASVAEVAFSDGSQPTGDVTITIPLPARNANDEVQVNGRWVPVSMLEAWSHNTQTGQWEKLDAPVLDLAAGTARFKTKHFSFFTLASPVAGITNLSGLRVYPNPFKPNAGNAAEGVEYQAGVRFTGITFENIPAGSQLKIYTSLGEMIDEMLIDASGGTQWDVRNGRGEKVASGVYIYSVIAPNGDRRTGKLMVIR